jgi:Homing endonuclease associated repeat
MARNMANPMTREEIMAQIVELSRALGHVPSHKELTAGSKVSGRQIVKYFGTYTRALRACNLDMYSSVQKLPLEKLFQDWARVVRQLKKIPSKNEYTSLGQHSTTPLKTRFENWGQVPRHLRRYIEDQGTTEEWKDVLELIREYEEGKDGMEMVESPAWEQAKPRVLTDRPLYGPLVRQSPLIHGPMIHGPMIHGPMIHGPMIHGPMNEAGVIYLFGTLSDRLGFVVTRIQSEFPDCEAMRLVDEDRWQRVAIEFEYESRNFVRHQHDVNGCDLIVCWKHNWEECPLEVVELRRAISMQ